MYLNNMWTGLFGWFLPHCLQLQICHHAIDEISSNYSSMPTICQDGRSDAIVPTPWLTSHCPATSWYFQHTITASITSWSLSKIIASLCNLHGMPPYITLLAPNHTSPAYPSLRYITLHGNQTSAYTKSPADSSLHRLLAIQNTGSWVADWPPAAGFGKMMCLQMEPNTVYYIHSVKYTEHIKMIKSTNSNPLYDGRKMPILFLFWSLFFCAKNRFF